MPSLTYEPSKPGVAAVSTPDIVDLRAEGLGAMDVFGEEPPGLAELVSPTPTAVGSTLTYERYYGLREKPFSLSTDPRFLYRSGSHAPVLEDLAAAIKRREGLIVLTGDIGTGKTTLCRAVISQLDRKTFATFVPDPFVTREDLLKTMLIEFGVMSVDDLVKGRLKGASRPDLSYPLYEFLRSLEPLDAFAVLVIDEVQNLSLPLLEEIRILSDLEAGGKLLQVVLIGQPEFESHLQLPRMRQIEQRVSVHCVLQPLGRDEVGGYVSHRLRLAGAASDQVRLTDEALDVVFAAAGGVPRVINLLCDKALSLGQQARTSRIGGDLIRAAIAGLRLRPASPEAAIATAMREPDPVAQNLEAAPSPPPEPLASPVPEVPAHSIEPSENARLAEPSSDRAPESWKSKGLFEARPMATVPPRGDDLLALLDLPTVNLHVASDHPVRGTARVPPPAAVPLVRGKVWRGASRLRPVAIAALATLGAATGVSTAGYWLWLRPIWTAAVPLPSVARPSVVVTSLGPLVIGSPRGRSVSPASVEVQGAPAPSPAQAEAGQWAIQTGAFANPARAMVLVSRLAALGFPAFDRDLEFGSKGQFRVALVGPYATRSEAETALRVVRAVSGLEQSVLRRVGE